MSKIVGGLIVLILGVLVALRLFVINVSVVPQNGMYPTISGGSFVFSWKRPYGGIATVERGDIVFFNRIQQGQTYLYVWRVVGLPGDKVFAAKDVLSLNGSPLKREVIRDEGSLVIFKETAGTASYEIAIAKAPRDIPPDVEVTVGSDELFVVGDNRYNAVDSRYFGPIKFATVVGRKL
jgi:signal peptidase I